MGRELNENEDGEIMATVQSDFDINFNDLNHLFNGKLQKKYQQSTKERSKHD